MNVFAPLKCLIQVWANIKFDQQTMDSSCLKPLPGQYVPFMLLKLSNSLKTGLFLVCSNMQAEEWEKKKEKWCGFEKQLQVYVRRNTIWEMNWVKKSEVVVSQCTNYTKLQFDKISYGISFKRINDHSKLFSTKSKFEGLSFIYLLCTSCKRESILEIKTKNDPNSKA